MENLYISNNYYEIIKYVYDWKHDRLISETLKKFINLFDAKKCFYKILKDEKKRSKRLKNKNIESIDLALVKVPFICCLSNHDAECDLVIDNANQKSLLFKNIFSEN